MIKSKYFNGIISHVELEDERLEVANPRGNFIWRNAAYTRTYVLSTRKEIKATKKGRVLRTLISLGHSN